MSAMLQLDKASPFAARPLFMRVARKLPAAKISQQFMFENVQDDYDVSMDGGKSALREGRFIFECAWEVANRVRSVYTILRTKAGETTAELGDQYCMLGPLTDDAVKREVAVMEPTNESIKFALDYLRNEGFKAVYGKWLIDGYPNVVLLDVKSAEWMLMRWKHELYETWKIGLPWQDNDSKNCCAFGFLTAKFLQKFTESHSKANRSSLCVAHFHDWQSAIGLILSRVWNTDVSTIFTVHATRIGQHLRSLEEDFYRNIDEYDVDEQAIAGGVYHRHCIERIAVSMAHVFTTPSEMTGFEATHLLARAPDLLTPNGMNVVKPAVIHEFQNLHEIMKEKIHSFIRGHFYGHYCFDLKRTIYFFTSGHYDFADKGGDFFIEALARLNNLLKKSTDSRCKGVTVVAFIVYPARTNSFNAESLKGQAVCRKLCETVGQIKDNIAFRIFDSCLRCELPTEDLFLVEEERNVLKEYIRDLKKWNHLPPICTHKMLDDAGDSVLNALRRSDLINRQTDCVKVIFYPDKLSSNSALLRIDYEDFVRGCHMGVFPSRYQPWGYTTAECTIMGVPSVTTNLSGIGCFIQKHVCNPDSHGVHVVDRRYKTREEAAEDLAQCFYDYLLLDHRQRMTLRNRTMRLSELFDWKNLGSFYREARRLVLQKTHSELDLKVRDASMKASTAELSPCSRSASLLSTQRSSGDDDSDIDSDEQLVFKKKARTEN